MIVVPFAHDQPDNAVRLERLGVARSIYPQHYKDRRVRATLSALLADEHAKASASEIGAKVRAERCEDNAVDALETLA